MTARNSYSVMFTPIQTKSFTFFDCCCFSRFFGCCNLVTFPTCNPFIVVRYTRIVNEEFDI
ncbi:hypothetical protein T02_3074 [Trichinella nativa]|uniref:Uncharacterized protein n=1 Tax=Trichinella nativa TaxID=6335 RepID=A0A0V1KKE8_9BILA|nr:hypothetical protein T02_3074 [Trichinella nativa]